jgi:ribonuclease P protein component
LKFITLKKRASFMAGNASALRWHTKPCLIQAVKITDVIKTEARRASPELINGFDAHFIGYTATKKLGNAVIRNRAKRRLRAATREVLLGIPTRDFAFIFVAKIDVLEIDYTELLSQLRWGLKKLYKLQKDST